MPRPLIGITADLILADGRERITVAPAYARAVLRAGGVPVVLAPLPGTAEPLIARLDAVVFTGGDDPRTEPFGVPTDPRTTPLHPDRQAFETELLTQLGDHPRVPVLGVCLGMQMMALVAGGSLDQHLPATLSSHARHWDHDHAIAPEPGADLPRGTVHSRHKQAVADPGRCRVTARSDDGVIEAIDDPARLFYLGVQWHPERTDHAPLGQALFERLIAACR